MIAVRTDPRTTGLIGEKLIQKLRQSTKYELSLLLRRQKSKYTTTDDVKTIMGDMTKIDTLFEASRGMDIVIHGAAVTHTHDTNLYEAINFYGTNNLIQAAERCGVKQFIFLSTRAASHSGGAYAKSKILAEESLSRSRLNWVIVRVAEVYGTQSPEGIQKVINVITKGYPLPILGKGLYTLAPVFVDDVVSGIIATIDNDQAGRKVYTLEGPKEYTFIELVDVLEGQLERKILKVYLPIYLVKILAFFLYLLKSELLYRDQIPRLLCSKTRDDNYSFKDLGVKPRQMEATVKTIYCA